MAQNDGKGNCARRDPGWAQTPGEQRSEFIWQFTQVACLLVRDPTPNTLGLGAPGLMGRQDAQMPHHFHKGPTVLYSHL